MDLKRVSRGPAIWVIAAVLILLVGARVFVPNQYKKIDTYRAIQLIEQNQALLVGRPQNVRDARNVRTEGAERLFQALLVANVGKDMVADGDLAPLAGGNVHPRLGHRT